MIFIRYYNELIIDKSVDMDITDIKALIDEGTAVYNLYVICVSAVGNSVLELLSCGNLLKTVNSYKDYGIVAMAKGRENINDVLINIIRDWIASDRDLSFLKDYYNNRCY